MLLHYLESESAYYTTRDENDIHLKLKSMTLYSFDDSLDENENSRFRIIADIGYISDQQNSLKNSTFQSLAM